MIQHARLWPREIFDREKAFVRNLPILNEPGVYVLYRDDVPYYIGQAKRLRSRLSWHANVVGSRYHNFWNFFSVFVAKDPAERSQIEAILIAAMPTANSAKPNLDRQKIPVLVRKMMRELRQHRVKQPDGVANSRGHHSRNV